MNNYLHFFKQCLSLTLVLLLITPVAANTKKLSQNKELPLDTIVAVVNDEVITESELRMHIRFYTADVPDQSVLPDEKLLRTQILNKAIDQTLGLQTAARLNISIDDDILDKSIQGIAANAEVTTEQLKNNLARKDINYQDYREFVRKELIVQRVLQQELVGKIDVSKSEVEKYLNSVAFDQQNVAEYHIADILLSLSEVPSSQEVQIVTQKVNTVVDALKAGDDFKQLAMAYSDAPNALQGGDLGWRRVEEIPTVFAEKVTDMQEGSYIGPIRTPNGFHLVKLQGIRGAAVKKIVTEHKVRHILLKPEVIDDDADVKAKLLQLRQQIESGEIFAKVAKRYSQDPVSAAKGGDLGWVSPGMMVKPFEQAMQKQKIGIVGEPEKTEYGWHLILVEARREKDHTKDFYASELRKKIFQRKYAEEVQNWLQRARDSSYVEIVLPSKPGISLV